MEELWSALWAPHFPGRMHAMIQPQTAPQAKKWGLTSFAVTRQRDPRVRVWHQMIACKVLPKSCRTAIATLSICVVCVPRVIVGGPARGALEPGSTRGSLLYIGLHHAQQFVALGAVAGERAAWIPLGCCGTASAVAMVATSCSVASSGHQITSCLRRAGTGRSGPMPSVYGVPRTRGTGLGGVLQWSYSARTFKREKPRSAGLQLLIDGAAAVVPVTLRLLSANCGALLSAAALVYTTWRLCPRAARYCRSPLTDAGTRQRSCKLPNGQRSAMQSTDRIDITRAPVSLLCIPRWRVACHPRTRFLSHYNTKDR